MDTNKVSTPPPNAFSIDVEEWFHILDAEQTPDFHQWEAEHPRVEANTTRLLELLEQHQTKATFFFLGWIAEQYPELVKKVASHGHEIASHGYCHTLVYHQSDDEFKADLRKSADLIEKACGIRPKAYRAPGFSITEDVMHRLDIIRDEGYIYDASLLPGSHGHGGVRNIPPYPHHLPNGLLEIPISTVSLGITRIAYLGGGYLRLFPFTLMKRFSQADLRQNRPLVLYIHPRDIDPQQPRLALPAYRRFKSYVGLDSAYHKLDQLLATFDWGTMEAISSHYRNQPDSI